MKRQCERCQATFECQPTAIDQCQCNQWAFPPAARTLIAQQYQDCLCAACLQALGAVIPKSSLAAVPKPPKLLD